MNDKVKILRDYSRMCEFMEGCYDCKFYTNNNGEHLPCEDFMKKHPEKAVEIIEKWAKEHPEKTYLDDFREKFPKAEFSNGYPFLCVKRLHGIERLPENCVGKRCKEC